MSNRIFRILVLACSLIFALPQGWCCLFAIQTTDKVGTCSKAGSSGCCCHCTTPRPSKSEKSPAKPVPIQNCPCAERNAVLTTSSAELGDVDLGQVAILTDINLPHHKVGVVERVPCSVHAPPRSLHVLHCIWLC